MDDSPIYVTAYNSHPSSGGRFFQSKRAASTTESSESDLLKTIRAALQGSGKNPNPPFRTVLSPSPDDPSGEEELNWDEHVVIRSAGGVLKHKWSFEAEGEPIQYACFGWLLQPGSGSATPGIAARYMSSEINSPSARSSPSSSYPTADNQQDGGTFSPFFCARTNLKARLARTEPPSYARGVFIFLRSFGKVVLSNGLEHTFALPFIVRHAWPLAPHGVLMQRALDPEEIEELSRDGAAGGEEEALPTLYTLTNPFQEPRPVGCTEGITGGYQSRCPELPASEREGHSPLRALPATEQVLWVSNRLPDTQDDLFATINVSRTKLSFWRYVYVVPKDTPTTSALDQPRLRRSIHRGPSLGVGSAPSTGFGEPLGMRHASTGGKDLADLVARDDRARAPSPDFALDPTQAVEFSEMPPLSSLPGMPPTLSGTTTLASLASGASALSGWPSSAGSGFAGVGAGRRRGSMNRNDLTSTMDRMVLGRRSEIFGMHEGSGVVSQRLQPVYWAEKLYEHDLSEKDSEAWKKLSVAIFDQRFDGARDHSLLALCLPASETLMLFELIPSQEDYTLKMSPLIPPYTIPAVSVIPVKATRPNVWDLLVLRPNSELAILTFGLREIPIEVDTDSLDALSVSPIYDLSMRDAKDDGDGDLSMVSVVDKLKIVALRDLVLSSVTLVYADGHRTRISLSLLPSDPATLTIVQTLSAHIPATLFFRVYRRFMSLWARRRKSGLSEVQLRCLAEAILGIFGVPWNPEVEGSEQPATSTWQALTHSASYSRLRDDSALMHLRMPSNFRTRPSPRLRAPQLSHTAKVDLQGILMALHLVGEDMRLSVHMHEALSQLATLIIRIAQLVRPGWADYWKRIFPDASDEWVSGIDFSGKEDVITPLDVSSTLYTRLSTPEIVSKHLDAVASRRVNSYVFGRVDTHSLLRDLTTLYTALADPKQKDSRQRAEGAVLQMAQQQRQAGPHYGGCFGPDFMSLLPLSVAAPLREAARTCQLGPPNDWPVGAYEFVGRNDLTEAAKASGDLMFNDGYRSIKDHLKPGAPRKTFRTLFEEAHRAIHHGDEAVTGVELDLADFMDIRFGLDRRVQEVSRMLRSSYIPSIRMFDRPELNEHELAKEQQAQVLRTAERTLALPLGRAMFTFGSVPTVTREVYTVPKIELSIRLQPHNVCIAPEPGKIPPEALHWAEFHNGVAAALRISPATGAIDSSWISFNRPAELTAEHAGFLFGMGLTGHLKEMLTWHTFGYLTPKHDLTSIGVLLGLSAANIGNGNKHVTKLLAVHTPALLPSPDVELNVPLSTQAAGLVGIGLLYMGTKNRRMAEVALHQISRADLLHPDLSNENREAYTTAAALSFGMIMLGRGTVTTSPADVALLSRLRALIHGEGPSAFRAKKSTQSLDINLTSPAATIALGLMYLRTDRQDVADILTIPDSVMGLNHIQPNFLLIRTLARALIMWENIKPTKDWIHRQIPQPIVKAMEAKMRPEQVDDAIALAYYHIISGACFAIGLKFAGTAREEAYIRIIEYYDFFSRAAAPSSPAFDHKIKRAAIRDGLNLISLSLNMVMAGTGEINCLRRLRYAHGMYNAPIRYGSHLATHMSLGLLFLGGGRFTLGNSNAAIACMITAFYPHFPPISSDNRAFLPALRHLWVLAVEPRCLIARDVDTKEVVYLPMKIRVKEENGIGNAQLIAPTLIPGLDRLLSIKVDTPRYWPFFLDIAGNARHREGLLQSQTLFVKRRTMFLSYHEDPKGSRSLFVRSGMSTGDAATLDFPQLTDTSVHPASDVQHFITSHSNDVLFISFADRFCRADGCTQEEKIFNSFCHAALLDCIIQDKPQMLSSYLAIYRARVMSPRSRYFQLVQLDLLRTADFYQKLFERRFSGRVDGILRPALLREHTVTSALHTVDGKLRAAQQKAEFKRALRAYVFDQCDSDAIRSSDENPDLSQELAWYLQRHAMPYAPYFPVLRQFAQEALEGHSAQPPPKGTLGTKKNKELEESIKLVLHSSVAGLVRPSGNWTMESFEDVLRVWQSS